MRALLDLQKQKMNSEDYNIAWDIIKRTEEQEGIEFSQLEIARDDKTFVDNVFKIYEVLDSRLWHFKYANDAIRVLRLLRLYEIIGLNDPTDKSDLYKHSLAVYTYYILSAAPYNAVFVNYIIASLSDEQLLYVHRQNNYSLLKILIQNNDSHTVISSLNLLTQYKRLNEMFATYNSILEDAIESGDENIVKALWHKATPEQQAAMITSNECGAFRLTLKKGVTQKMRECVLDLILACANKADIRKQLDINEVPTEQLRKRDRFESPETTSIALASKKSYKPTKYSYGYRDALKDIFAKKTKKDTTPVDPSAPKKDWSQRVLCRYKNQPDKDEATVRF